MARVVDHPPATPPDPWSTVPVEVGRHRRRPGWGVIALLLVAGVAALALTRTTPTMSSKPAPAAQQPGPRTAPSVPFDVTIEVTDAASMDNDGLFGQNADVPGDAVDTAAEEVVAVLDRYLDAEFIAAETRFSDRPLSELLSQRALDSLSEADLAGLGVLGLSVQQVEAEPVTATARVLTSGSDVGLVVVRYEARARVITGDGVPAGLQQRASMVFAPDDGTWRVDAVDAELDLPVAETTAP